MILISAGHSDTDTGAVFNHFKESELALDLRDSLADVLTDVPFITDGEPQVNNPLRDAITLMKKCSFGIEFHFNSSSNKTVRGCEVFGQEKFREQGTILSKLVSTCLKTPDRGFKLEQESPRKRLGFVRAGGLILEVEFITNEEAMNNYLLKKHTLIQGLNSYLKGIDNAKRV